MTGTTQGADTAAPRAAPRAARRTTAGARRRARFPRWVYEHGGEPDPRFTLANERTFLAWIRTALALVAGGVALEALALPVQPRLRLAASLVLLGTGMMLPLVAWRDWGATERALRRGEPLPATPTSLPLAVAVAVVAVLVLLGVLVR